MYDIYIVEEGDTLESLAKKFNVSVYDIIQMNHLEGIFELMPGMKLQIPVDRTSAFTFYKIKPGDTLYSIAMDHNTSPEYILLLNGLNANEYIYPGQQILIPKENVAIYLTKPGDSLQMVAENTNQRPEDILIYNEKLYLLPEQLIAYKKRG